MSLTDDFVSSNVVITSNTSSTSLRVTKAFALDFLYIGVIFVLINNTFA